MPPLVKAGMVEVAVINDLLGQQVSSESMDSRKVASCYEYVRATAEVRDRAVQSEQRQVAPRAPKRLTERKQGMLSAAAIEIYSW